jgi:hypothetical protein
MNWLLSLSSGISSTPDVFRLPEFRLSLYHVKTMLKKRLKVRVYCAFYPLNPARLLLVTHRELIRRHQLWIIFTNAQFYKGLLTGQR